MVITRSSYPDLVAGVVACLVCDAQKPGGGSLHCRIANTKPNKYNNIYTYILGDLDAKFYRPFRRENFHVFLSHIQRKII